MNVLWVSADYHPDVGGIETYVASITQSLSIDHNILLVTDSRQWIEVPSRVRHIGCVDLGGTNTSDRWRQCLQRLSNIVSDFNSDIVHLANAGMAVFARELSRRVPVVCSVHGNDLTSPWQLLPEGDSVSEIIHGLSCCDALIAVSQYTAKLIRSRAIDRPMEVIPNSCDTRMFHRRTVERDLVLRNLGIPPTRKIVLTVARIEARKGHFLVLEALQALTEDWHWIVVGRGSLGQKLKTEVDRLGLGSRVSMLGRCSLEQLVRLYTICDTFVLVPLILVSANRIDSEGFGVVYQEAGACGAPVIGSRESGSEEAVCHGETGLLVSPGKVDQLRSAIEWMLSNPAAARAMGCCAAKRIHATSGWDGVAKRIEGIYTRMIRTNSEVRRPS